MTIGVWDRIEIATQPTMITFIKTTADRILKLRYQVLRPRLSIAEVIFAEDQEQETRHYEGIDYKGKMACFM